MRDETLEKIAQIYFIGILISSLYFNWEYAKTHGFLKWLFFGEIVATLKGFLWPIYFLLYLLK